ncbi:ABC transporter [Frankia sp. R43]|uniref:ABC transporter permease subunit n=1 Tax=Frankia sp. R43 TaxID=269536 RepID=UPI0006CA2E9A|nr:ATP-binding cassette domain-containing protein [Frankia sp. R43]KPM57123.1 ABC transporter [Frankia sp. R43]
MNDVMGYVLLSLGTGALYALVATGVVVVQRGAGVLNMAQGALLAWSAYAFHGASSVWGLPRALAALLAVGSTMAIGVAFQHLVLRPMRQATAVLRLMATLGLLIVIQSSLTLMYGSDVRNSPTVLPTSKVTLFDTAVGVDVFTRLAVVVVVVAGLWAVFRFTTLGLAATAVTENARAAATLGWSPDAVASWAWLAGSALAGLGGVLLAPLQNPLSAGGLMLLIVPGLAVALVARFRSLPAVLVGALALAAVELELQVHLVADHPVWRGVDRAVPLAVIVFYLAVRGRGIPDRGHVAERHPSLGSGRVYWRALGAAVAGALVCIWWLLPAPWVNALNANAIWAMIILSVVVLVGFTGQLSLAQLAFSGTAALIAGRLVAVQGWPLEAALVVGVAGTALVGVLFALPALRTRGLQLAVVTLGLGAAVDALLFQRGYHSPAPASPLGDLFGDLSRLEGTEVGDATLLGVHLDKVSDPRGFATLSLLAFTVLALLVANLRRGRAGRRLIAVRTNERAAAALGISVVGAKIYAFALSAAIAGFGGVLYAFYAYGERGNIDYGGGLFSPFASILLIAYAVVGGVGWTSGAFAGATMAADALATRVGAWVGSLLAQLGAVLRLLLAALAAIIGLALGRAVAPRRPAPVGGSVGGPASGPAGRPENWATGEPAPGAGEPGPHGAGRLAGRALPWLTAAVCAGVAFAAGGRIVDWLADLDRYVPLIGGLVLVTVLSRSGGGMAPENARTARRVLERRFPAALERRAAADAARVTRLLGAVPAIGTVAAGPAGPAVRAAPVAPAQPAAPAQPTAPAGPVATGLETGPMRQVGSVGYPARPATLSAWGLSVRFGAVEVIRGVDLRVEPGQIVGVIGPNGAGKTTVIDAITGYTGSVSQSLMLGEARLDRLPAHLRARAGISRSFQNLELFEDLTVMENIQAACDPRDARAYLGDLVLPRARPLPAAAAAAVEAFGLRADLLRPVSELPYGRRRLLAIARAVATCPSVLLLDEPCAGLDENESAGVATLLRRLADHWGLGILLNEHDMEVVMRICDQVVVLDGGEVIARGTPGQIRVNERVRDAYLGPADPAVASSSSGPAGSSGPAAGTRR